MKVFHVNSIVSLLTYSFFSGIVQGIIKNDDKNIIREEERRGSGRLENEMQPDQNTYDSFKRDVWAIGQNPKGQHDECQHCQPNRYDGEIHDTHRQHGFGLVAPDNLGYPLGSGGQYDTKVNEPNYGFGHSSAGSGLSYGYSGGIGSIGHSGVGIGNVGYGGGGLGNYGQVAGIDNLGHGGGGIGNFGHSGGGISYFGHSGGGVGNFGHSGGGIGGYGHSGVGGEYGPSIGGFGGLTSLIQKKLSLKKIIIPIAAIALLGAAAAMTTNPVLLQLGTISGRRKRSIPRKLDRNLIPPNPFVRPNRV